MSLHKHVRTITVYTERKMTDGNYGSKCYSLAMQVEVPEGTGEDERALDAFVDDAYEYARDVLRRQFKRNGEPHS
jgi:hypothetical protein